MTTPAEVALAREKGRIVAEGFDFVNKGTEIDRRHAKRVRPMEVLGLGLPRTGTVSTRAALLQLGYWDTYHCAATMIENTSDCELWYEAFDAKFFGKGKPYGRKEFDGLLGHCMALTDVPCVLFAPELVAAYPDAKIILIVRDSPAAWLASWRDNIAYYLDLLYFPTWTPWILFVRTFSTPLPLDGLFERQFRALKVFKRADVKAEIYESHNRTVRRLAGVPEDGSVKRTARFLEFNVREGWAPLCDFLGKDVPNMAFPRVNEGAQFRERTDILFGIKAADARARAARYAGVFAGIAVAVGGVWYTSGRI